LECELPMPAHVYVVERDTAAFRSLYAQAMFMGKLDVVGEETNGDTVMVHTRCYPEKEKFVPGALQRFIRGDIIHEEQWWYDAAKLREAPFELRFKQIPPLVGAGADVTGTVVIEAVSPSRCKQTLTCEANVKPLFGVPGTGRIAAQGIKDNLTKAYNLLPQVLDKWLVVRKALLDDEHNARAMWEGDAALRHLSQTVMVNIRNPPAKLLRQISKEGASLEELGTVVRVEKRGSKRSFRRQDSTEGDSVYEDARSVFSRSALSGRNTPAAPEERDTFYDAVEYFYFNQEEKMQASTVTELGLIRASGAVVDRQPGLLGGVHDTKKFVQAADAWSKFWARMGIDIVLIESEPKKRMYLSVRALGVAAITAGAVGIAVGMVLGAFAIKPLLKQNKQRARKKAKPKSKTTKGATKAGPASKPVTDHTKPSPSSIPNVEQPASSTVGTASRAAYALPHTHTPYIAPRPAASRPVPPPNTSSGIDRSVESQRFTELTAGELLTGLRDDVLTQEFA